MFKYIMDPIIHINYKIDKEKLLSQAASIKQTATGYTDTRYPEIKMDDWLVGHCSSEYANKIMDDLGIQGKPRFYWLQPNAIIPEHVDNGTLCGLNFILTDDASPITFGDKDYFYEAVLVDTTRPHSVTNNQNERVMFKISIFNETFEQVASKIKKFIV